MRFPWWRGTVSSAVLVALTGPPLVAQTATSGSAAIASGIESASRATVFIEITGPAGPATGSGVLLTGTGTVATAAHVIHGASAVRVKLTTGEVFDAIGVFDYDERLDVTLLAIPGFGLPAAPLGNSDSVVVGQRLLALGAPLGLETTVSDGLLSAIRLDGGSRLFQVSIPVSPGSSGGPVITERGEVVGLVVSSLGTPAAQNLNFVLPINYVRGRLASSSARTPIPFAQVQYGAAPAARGLGIMNPGAESGTPALGSTGLPLQRVNDSLPLEWGLLDGVQLYSEEKAEGQLRSRSLVKFAVTKDPSGVLVVERTSVIRIRSEGYAARDLAEDMERTIVHIGPINKWSVTATRQSYLAGVASDYGSLQVHGSRFVGMSAGISVQGDAPPGVLPSSIISGAVAAHTGDLPPRLQVWLLDPTGNRAMPQIVEIAGRETRKIPFAKSGTNCGKDSKTERRTRQVLLGTRIVGTQRAPVVLLADAPHLLVDETVKCVHLPER